MRRGYSKFPDRSIGQADELGEAEGVIEVFVTVAKVELPCTGPATEDIEGVPPEVDEAEPKVEGELDRGGAGFIVAGEVMVCKSLEEYSTAAEDTELILGAGNGPGIGVCVDPASLSTKLEVLPLAAELCRVDATLETDEEADGTELEDADDIVEHSKLYSGVVDKLDATMPKLGLGVVGAASCKVYHQVLTVPNKEHPT